MLLAMYDNTRTLILEILIAYAVLMLCHSYNPEDHMHYNRTQNKRATPINPVGTLFMVNIFALVDCATVELEVREGFVAFDAGRVPFPALTPPTALAALAYALIFCGPDAGLRWLTKNSRHGSTHGLITPTIPA